MGFRCRNCNRVGIILCSDGVDEVIDAPRFTQAGNGARNPGYSGFSARAVHVVTW